MGVRARFDSKCGRSVGVGGYPAPAAWFRFWAQKIAELNLRFCEQQQGPLKSLVRWFVRWGYGGSIGRPLGRISCHRGTVCSLLLGASLVSRENGFSGRFRASDDSSVVQGLKSPSQLVFVSSIAISQDDRIAGFGASGRRSFPTQNGPLSNVLGVMFLTLCSLV